MVRLLVRVFMGVTLFTQCQVSCEENGITDVVFTKIEDLDEELVDVKRGMARIEETVVNKIDFAKATLRSELKQHIKQLVKEAMAEILQGESIEEMVRSQVVSEVRKLKHGHQQMKRQLHQIMKSVRDIQGDRKLCKESLLKAERNASEFLTCSKYVVDSMILQRDLEQCNKEINERNTENQELTRNMISLNETCQLSLQKANTSSDVTRSVESSSTSAVTTTSPTTTQKLQLQKVNISSDVTTSVQTLSSSPTTIQKPEEERSRIIVVPFLSGIHQQFSQLNFNSNTLSSYPYLSHNRVTSLAYVARLKKLLIGLSNPHKIISSNLDSSGVTTMREGVEAYGMAVDEDRELVFTTTNSPRRISRMTTRGKHFTTISNLSDYSWTYAIAIDSEEEKIYICCSTEVLMIPYDGRYIKTLTTGNYMYALTLDNAAGNLYYNDGKKLMKIFLSNNVSSNVTNLSVYPWNLIYHNNTVYFSRYVFSDTLSIGAFYVRYENVSYPLQTISGSGGSRLIMCLVP